MNSTVGRVGSRPIKSKLLRFNTNSSCIGDYEVQIRSSMQTVEALNRRRHNWASHSIALLISKYKNNVVQSCSL